MEKKWWERRTIWTRRRGARGGARKNCLDGP